MSARIQEAQAPKAWLDRGSTRRASRQPERTEDGELTSCVVFDVMPPQFLGAQLHYFRLVGGSAQAHHRGASTSSTSSVDIRQESIGRLLNRETRQYRFAHHRRRRVETPEDRLHLILLNAEVGAHQSQNQLRAQCRRLDISRSGKSSNGLPINHAASLRSKNTSC